MSKAENAPRARTRLVHAGRSPRDQHGFVNPPVYRGSTVLFPTTASLENRDQEYTYGRRGTPTLRALEQALTELEGGAELEVLAVFDSQLVERCESH